MPILSRLKAKKLTSEITCTSYYDFLTSGYHCLESLDCRDIPSDPPIQKELKRPPGLPKHRVKYFGVDDNAAEWYRNTRALKIKKPLLRRRKCRFRFRVPIQRTKAATYSVPGRRVSPEFLSLLKQDHAKKRGLEQLPRKYRSRKPSFSYYKYDAEGKSRHMRPGISTAAPLEFPPRDLICTCVSSMERDMVAYHRHSSQGQRKTEEVPKLSGLHPLSARTKPNKKHSVNKKRSVHFEGDKGDEDIYRDMEQQKLCQGEDTCLKNLQDTDNLQEKVANQNTAGLNRMYNSMTQPLQFQEPPKTIAFNYQPAFKPTENVTSGTGPFGQQGTECLQSCNHSKCPSQQWRFRRHRDPCFFKYENSPFSNAIQGSSYGGCSRDGGSKLRSQCTSEKNNNIKMCSKCEEKALDGSSSKEPAPENSFYAPPISYHLQLGVDCTQRSQDIPENITGYKGFVHRSENTQKSKLCGHLFPGVDPATRQAEMERLAKLMFSETNPNSSNWFKTNPEIREQRSKGSGVNPSLVENDEQPSENPISSCFSLDKSKADCPCKRPSCPRSPSKPSSDFNEQIGTYTLLSQAREPPQPEKSSRKSQRKPVSILKKVTTDWDRSLPKKARLLPRLHAFAKRFLWSGPKGHRFKSNKSDNERSDYYSNCRKVEKSNPYCIRNLSSGNSDARQKGYLQVGQVRHDFRENENQALPSVINRITFQGQARIQDIRGPRDPGMWAKFHQAKPRQRSSSPEIYRNSGPRRNGPTWETWHDPILPDPWPRKRSNTPLSSSPERDSNKRSRNPRRKPLLPPNHAQTSRVYDEPCSAECSRKDTTLPGIQYRATSKSHDNKKLASTSGYDTPTYPQERPRGRGPQQRVFRVRREGKERQDRKSAEKDCVGCKPCNNYSVYSRTSVSPCPRYRRGIVPHSNTESQAKSTVLSLSQPKAYRSPASKDPEDTPRRLQIKSRHCDLAPTVSKPSKMFSKSRRMRGGIDYREDDFIPGRNQDVPHSFPYNLPADTDSYQQVNYTRACKSSMHAFCFD